MICVSCEYHLPRTDFHEQRENLFTDRFWGRVDIQAAASLFYFRKGGLTQELIHKLKYKEKWQIGMELGKQYGHTLAQAPLFSKVDCIIPVPLHPYKEKLRGYNQSAVFANGLSASMGVPALPHAMTRRVHTETQTRKSRIDRLENVSEKFEVRQTGLLQRKHILLVDDVVTTGATLEACAEKLLAIPGTRVSLATIAYAKY
jgi:ComF family protein